MSQRFYNSSNRSELGRGRFLFKETVCHPLSVDSKTKIHLGMCDCERAAKLYALRLSHEVIPGLFLSFNEESEVPHVSGLMMGRARILPVMALVLAASTTTRADYAYIGYYHTQEVVQSPYSFEPECQEFRPGIQRDVRHGGLRPDLQQLEPDHQPVRALDRS
jgi:hypothetical protein